MVSKRNKKRQKCLQILWLHMSITLTAAKSRFFRWYYNLKPLLLVSCSPTWRRVVGDVRDEWIPARQRKVSYSPSNNSTESVFLIVWAQLSPCNRISCRSFDTKLNISFYTSHVSRPTSSMCYLKVEVQSIWDLHTIQIEGLNAWREYMKKKHLLWTSKNKWRNLKKIIIIGMVVKIILSS